MNGIQISLLFPASEEFLCLFNELSDEMMHKQYLLWGALATVRTLFCLLLPLRLKLVRLRSENHVKQDSSGSAFCFGEWFMWGLISIWICRSWLSWEFSIFLPVDVAVTLKDSSQRSCLPIHRPLPSGPDPGAERQWVTKKIISSSPSTVCTPWGNWHRWLRTRPGSLDLPPGSTLTVRITLHYVPNLSGPRFPHFKLFPLRRLWLD